MKTKFLSLLLLSGLLFAAEPSFTERIGLDPVLRGVWTMHAYSDDGGKNWKNDLQGQEIAVARAASIRFATGETVTLDKVFIYESGRAGDLPANVALLDNGARLVFTKKLNNPLVLVETMLQGADGEFTCTYTSVISIE